MMDYAEIVNPSKYDLKNGVNPNHRYVVSVCFTNVFKRFEVFDWLEENITAFSISQSHPFIRFFFPTEEDVFYFIMVWKGNV
jgi:hypothetical protein